MANKERHEEMEKLQKEALQLLLNELELPHEILHKPFIVSLMQEITYQNRRLTELQNGGPILAQARPGLR